ncbi:NAD(P)H-binding protein [Streptomyces sp. RY43-2]|uniref:NAD(P)H-binding protein n=1 Tax=Streptomyces macrolidinus TaxID=2952607 RepID=A0ABT0ZIE7_9ACTN|nr:NAD(P)H-binding protein [Streptomyces macrolidinus]MCN9243363.1 NAD(P)H-binding protein [Streptomyces macrolidinus]
MILVTGATGTIGREVVRCLGPERDVRILARDPARVVGASPCADVVAGDYADEASLARALAGVSRAFLVTNRIGDDDERFVRAARAAGVRHVVKLSAAAVNDAGAQDLITRQQRATEGLLRASGLAWTLLRPRSFMSNTLAWAPSVREERVVRALNGTSRNACVDPRDVAEVAVRALTQEGHTGCAYTLTGPEPLSARDQTRELGRQLGIELAFEELGLDAARALLGRRYPPTVVEALLESARRQEENAKSAVAPTVLEVTGRPARSYADWVADHLSAFRGP